MSRACRTMECHRARAAASRPDHRCGLNLAHPSTVRNTVRLRGLSKRHSWEVFLVGIPGHSWTGYSCGIPGTRYSNCLLMLRDRSGTDLGGEDRRG